MPFNTPEVSEYLGNIKEYFKFTANGTVYRYTSGQTETLDTGEPEVDGEYTAAGISIEQVEHAPDTPQLNVQVLVATDNPVALLFTSTPPVEILVQVYRRHLSDDQVIAWFSGEVMSCERRESEGGENPEKSLTCEPVLARVARLGLRMRWQPQCNLTLYGTRCGVDEDDFKSTTTVDAIDGVEVTLTGLLGTDPDYYVGGFVKTTDGSRRFVTAQAGNVLTLMLEFDDLDVGETVYAYAGCDRIHTTCRTKFFPAGGTLVAGVGNIRNMFGFFTLPGKNPFRDGGLKAAGASGFASLDGA